MALHEGSLTMQILADEDLLAIIMEYVDDPKTLCNLVMAFPSTKATFDRYPRQLLTASVSGLSTELQLLATLYVALKQDNVSHASMTQLVWGYLRLDDTPGFVEPPVAAVDFEMPRYFANPFEALRKLAAVWCAVEDLTGGFIGRSIEFIQACQAAKYSGTQAVQYDRGHKLRPLSHLWDEEINLEGLPEYRTLKKPQPWTLPLRASEINRVKRALWRLEVFAVLSQEPRSLPNDGDTVLGIANVRLAHPIKTYTIHPVDEQGTHMLFLASLQGSELAELESIYDYLWCETVGKAYQHKLNPYLPQSDGNAQQAQAEGKGGRMSRGAEHWEQEHQKFQAQLVMKRNAERAVQEHDRYVAYLMSLGLPFIHRVYQQISRDGNDIIPENYPPIQVRPVSGLRDTWMKLDSSRMDDIWRSYNNVLVQIKDDKSITRRPAVWPSPEDYPTAGTHSAMYLQTRCSNSFRVEDLWRAGCYMWERDEHQ